MILSLDSVEFATEGDATVEVSLDENRTATHVIDVRRKEAE
jgi:hypothetical protein